MVLCDRRKSKTARVTAGIAFDIDYLVSVLTECHNFCERYENGESPEYTVFECYMNERYNLLCVSSHGEDSLKRAHQISEVCSTLLALAKTHIKALTL
mgnify:CR=1 FL=1